MVGNLAAPRCDNRTFNVTRPHTVSARCTCECLIRSAALLGRYPTLGTELALRLSGLSTSRKRVGMEVLFFWHYNGYKRVPRAASFHAPAAPFLRLPQAAGSPHACALPAHSRRTSRAATIGHNVHEWADHHARYVLNSRGQRLFVQEWRPWEERPRGRLLLVHGLNDHSNKYAHVVRRFVDAGFTVVAHDAHGHGRSDGFRAHATSFDHYVDDAGLVLRDTVKRALPASKRIPTFILGHSLGGAVAIHLARERPPPALRGVLLTAPAVRVYSNRILRALAPVLATLAPLLPVQRVRFDKRRATDRRTGDPLIVRCSVRARVGYEVLKSCDRIMGEAKRFRAPLFVAHSKKDRVTNVSGSIEFCNKVASRDKSVALYEGKQHDLLAKCSSKVLDDMVAWTERRLN